MERIYQMKVVPDALPELNPTIDLQVIARTLPADFLKTKKVFKAVEPGIYLRPKQVSSFPFSMLMSSFIFFFRILDFAVS
jgi:large subunit ribosomal protein L35